MNDMDIIETQKYVQSLNPEVSLQQLTRWHPYLHPQQILCGRKGSMTVYPIGTAALVKRIHQGLKEKRNIDDVAWRLWFEGHDINLLSIRSIIQRRSVEWEQAKRIINIIDFACRTRFRNKFISQMRKRVGIAEFQSLLNTLLKIARGQYSKDKFDAIQDQMDLKQAFGLQRLKYDPFDNGEALCEFSEFFGNLNFAAILVDNSDDELIQARNEFREYYETFGNGPAIKLIFGKSASGFAAVFSIIGSLLHSGSSRCLPLVLLFWIALKHKDEEKAKQFLENMNNCQTLVRHFEVIETINDEIPGIAEILSPKKIREGIRRPRPREKELQQFCAEHHEELSAFWERHPDLN